MRRSDGKQKARLLQLLRMLCGDDEVRVTDAAAHFGVDKRTIYRDLALLKRYFPIIDGKEGKRLDTTALQAHDEGISKQCGVLLYILVVLGELSEGMFQKESEDNDKANTGRFGIEPVGGQKDE